MSTPADTLNEIDAAIRTRLQDQLPALRSVNTLEFEGQLLTDGAQAPCAYVLIRGGDFKPPLGRGGEQRGDADVMVWFKALNVAHKQGAAKDDAYSLSMAGITALNGFAPVGDDFVLTAKSFGIASVAKAFNSVLAVKFSLAVALPHGRFQP